MSDRVTVITNHCIICGERTHPLIDDTMDVTYDACPHCLFIFKQPFYHPTKEIEEKRYLQHHNTDKNIGYVTYLRTFMKEHIIPLKNVKTVLDFGSGPEPILQKLLEHKGYFVDAYDPFFHNDETYLSKTYDLIVLTEVLEHIFEPLETIKHVVKRLKPNGYLLIMTQFRHMDEKAFMDWWYRRDITHVGFFHQTTFETIATAVPLTIVASNQTDVILFQKSS